MQLDLFWWFIVVLPVKEALQFERSHDTTCAFIVLQQFPFRCWSLTVLIKIERQRFQATDRKGSLQMGIERALTRISVLAKPLGIMSVVMSIKKVFLNSKRPQYFDYGNSPDPQI